MSAPDLNSWLGCTQYCLGICPASMAMSNDEIVATVTAALETAIQLVEDDDWNDEIAEDGAVVKSKINKEGRKIFLCTAKVNVAPKVLEKKMMDIDNLTSWNKTITESRILKNLKKDVFVSYQVTAEGGAGLVSARDFVYGGRAVHREGKFIVGGMSVEFEGQPGVGERVRAWHGPSCQVIGPVDGAPDMSSYTWLMDCEYRGMIPGSIINIALPRAQLIMIKSINTLGEENI